MPAPPNPPFPFRPRSPYIPPMRIGFWKMHGAGNDFVVLDARAAPLPLGPAQIGGLADRRTGIGCDQLVLLEPARGDGDVLARFFNPDGSESAACGNATRCIAHLLHLETGRAGFQIRTNNGLLGARRTGLAEYEIDMGPPALGAAQIPLARVADTLHLPLEGDPAACSMGNPHATWFVADLEAEPITTLGPSREHDPLFPERANIGFAQILALDRIRLKVWERGTGLTLACGSGACAALVNAHRRGLCARRAAVLVDGGRLTIEWVENDHVLMTGPAVLVYEGHIELPQ